MAKSECWLRSNRRALAAAMVVPGAVLLVAIAIILGWPSDHIAVRIAGFVLAVIAALALAGLAYLFRLPRLALADDQLLVYLQRLQPIHVPIDVVECFFLGEGLSSMPGAEETKVISSTIIVRLAESATDWKHRPVVHALGQWCDGYITIRGTWCEPITRDVLGRLNSRLVEVHRQRKSLQPAEAS